LPPAAVLGSDEAPEAALDQVRLAALGARVHADGDDRVVEILLADPSSQSVMVLRRVVSPQEGGRPEDGPALARRSALSGTPLGMVASCQLVSNAAVRRPNRLIHFQTGPLKKTSVLGGGATIDTLPQDLVVRDTAAFCKSLAARSPRALRPRLLAENVRAFALSRVEELGYDVGEQAVRASCLDESGHELLLTLRHRSVAPAALEALALHLGRSTVRAVVGDGRRVSGVLVVEPIALMTEKLVVLDLEPPSPEGEKALAALPHARSGLARSALSQAVDEARGVLDEAAHQGLRAPPPGWVERLREARLRLSELGLAHAADDLEVLEHAGAAARSTGAEVDEAGAVEAWATASLRLELLSDRL
jgi:hypothetical protein